MAPVVQSCCLIWCRLVRSRDFRSRDFRASSAACDNLLVPRTSTSTYSHRSCTVSVPVSRNSLYVPPSFHASSSVNIWRIPPSTENYLFRQAHGPAMLWLLRPSKIMRFARTHPRWGQTAMPYGCSTSIETTVLWPTADGRARVTAIQRYSPSVQ